MDVVRHHFKLQYLVAFGFSDFSSNRMQQQLLLLLNFKEFFYPSYQNWFSVLWTPHTK